MGEGSPDAVAIAIGEAPGAVEEVRHQPFVGSAGLIYRRYFLHGIEQKVFTTNILSCRPPRNRIPSPEEIDNCQDRLTELFLILKPTLLVFFGNVARDAFKSNLTERGVIEGHDPGCVWLYHPSYLLRQGGSLQRSPGTIASTALEQYANIASIIAAYPLPTS